LPVDNEKNTKIAAIHTLRTIAERRSPSGRGRARPACRLHGRNTIQGKKPAGKRHR
jgi:hypothetical protein